VSISTEVHLKLKRITANILQYIQMGLSLDLCNGNVTEGVLQSYSAFKFGGNVNMFLNAALIG